MRIISGKYKGHLVSFKAYHIRPTMDRVKESLFNILRADIEGAGVLDLFSGTGNLGIEALSRGARELTIVENNKKSIEIIHANLKKRSVQEPVKIICKDVLSFIKVYSGDPFDIIFADPPYMEEMVHTIMLTISASKIFHENSIMSIESGRREKIENDYGAIMRYDMRRFGDKNLSFFKKGSMQPQLRTKTNQNTDEISQK